MPIQNINATNLNRRLVAFYFLGIKYPKIFIRL